ncbi:MAG TPA: cation-translocating P-type ATPase, partial [Nitrospira sp.]|nr:cation-translocating P-type ATPase [Nitrospira sp.]
WKKFLAQFHDVLVVLLLIASAISAVLWLYERESPWPYEAMAILVVVLLNAVMGFVQQSRAEEAVAALRRMSAAQARVIREGLHKTVAATDLVPGDILLIEEGDTIPADARLIWSAALQTAEAALTGESLPVSKDPAVLAGETSLGDQHNMVFSGTTATYGHGRAVVTETGMYTQMGRIAGMLKRPQSERTALQKDLDRVGKRLGLIVVVIAALMITTVILIENVRGLSALFDVFILGVALAVAAVPEGLPAVVTAVLSLGVHRMAKRKAIVRRLAAVETLGSATIIATDKTGTLTKNEMTVRRLITASGQHSFTGTGYAPEGEMRREDRSSAEAPVRFEALRALAAADRANNAVLQDCGGHWVVRGDPTEGALIVAARKAGLDQEEVQERFLRLAEVPFSSTRKLMSTIHTDADKQDRLIAFTKGAPDVLLSRCTHELVGTESRPLSDTRRAEILRNNEELANQALRTLGVAFRSLPKNFEPEAADEGVEQQLVFLGLIGMMDPPREESSQAVARAKQSGISVIMITGDHPKTAVAIAKELGIIEKGEAITGAQLEQMPDEALERAVQHASVYARVNPEHKLRIVKALQRRDAIVAMTGDGVNDAPALRTADIGVAMGMAGTDVSREAADMVLADDNFATVVAAVEEGRAIFTNIRKFLRYLLSSNVGEVLTMFLGILLADFIGLRQTGGGLVVPLAATQILWLNLVTDGAPALALGVDPPDPGLMTEPPRPRHEEVITGSMWRGIFFIGIIMATGTLFVLDVSLPGGFFEGSGTIRHAQTMAFTTLVLFSLFTVFNARSDKRSAFKGLFSNLWLWGAVTLSLFLQAAVVYVPFLQQAFSTVSLSPIDWMYCALVASSVLWLRELSKILIGSEGGLGDCHKRF